MSCIIETQSFAWFMLHYEIWASELRVLKRECQWILGFLQNVYTWSRPGSRLRLRKHEISWIFFFCSMCVAWSRPGTGPFFGNLRAEVMLPTRVSYAVTHSTYVHVLKQSFYREVPHSSNCTVEKESTLDHLSGSGACAQGRLSRQGSDSHSTLPTNSYSNCIRYKFEIQSARWCDSSRISEIFW